MCEDQNRTITTKYTVQILTMNCNTIIYGIYRKFYIHLSDQFSKIIGVFGHTEYVPKTSAYTQRRDLEMLLAFVKLHRLYSRPTAFKLH